MYGSAPSKHIFTSVRRRSAKGKFSRKRDEVSTEFWGMEKRRESSFIHTVSPNHVMALEYMIVPLVHS